MIDLEATLVELLSNAESSHYEVIANYLANHSVRQIVLCENCQYLRRCRACCKCGHPYGLKEPRPDLGTFCSYGIIKIDSITEELINK